MHNPNFFLYFICGNFLINLIITQKKAKIFKDTKEPNMSIGDSILNKLYL